MDGIGHWIGSSKCAIRTYPTRWVPRDDFPPSTTTTNKDDETVETKQWAFHITDLTSVDPLATKVQQQIHAILQQWCFVIPNPLGWQSWRLVP